MTNSQRNTVSTQWVQVGGLILAGILAVCYVMAGREHGLQAHQRMGEFYGAPLLSWPGGDLSKSELLRFKLSTMTLMTVPSHNWVRLVDDTAYSRWRLREVSESPFRLLMNQWDANMLALMSESQWRSFYQRRDDQWQAARQESLISATQKPTEIALSQKPRVYTLRFRDPSPTTSLGSLLTFQMVALNEAVPRSPIQAGITMVVDGEEVILRRVGQVDISPADDPRMKRFTITFDLSWQGRWMTAGNKVSAIHLRKPLPGEWKLTGFTPGDSPFFPIPNPE